MLYLIQTSLQLCSTYDITAKIYNTERAGYGSQV